jgi:hypothetical protein
VDDIELLRLFLATPRSRDGPWAITRKTPVSPTGISLDARSFCLMLGVLIGLFFGSAHALEPGCVALEQQSQASAWSALAGVGCGNVALSIEEFAAKYGNKVCTKSADKRIICSGALRADNLRNVTVYGAGLQLRFTDPGVGKGGLVLTGASNVVIKNLNIGWLDVPPGESLPRQENKIHSMGSVVACNGDKGGALDLENSFGGEASVTGVFVWDDRLGWPWESRWSGKTVERYFPPFPKGAAMEFKKGRGPCIDKLQALAGMRVLISHHVYSANAVQCFQCERIAVENVTIHSAPGMGFYFANGGRGFLLRDIGIRPSCAPTCQKAQPSVSADAIHFSAVGGGIVIEGSNIGWQGDDSVNITGLLALGRPEKSKSDSGEGWLQIDQRSKVWFWLFRVEAEVLLFDLGLREYGSAKVLELDKEKLRVRLSTIPREVAELVITAADRVPRDVIVRNNTFHDHRGRAVMMGASNAVIEGNRIERLTMAAIMLPADTALFFEGPGAKNVRIVGNTISKVNARLYRPEYPAAISAAFHPSSEYKGPLGTPISDITIENNTFSDVFSNAANPVSLGQGVRGGSSKASGQENEYSKARRALDSVIRRIDSLERTAPAPAR